MAKATKPTKTSKAKKEAKALASDDIEKKPQGFNVRSYFDAEMDLIEKKTKISSRSIAMRGKRLSTGLLALDMFLGGGIVPGSWTTLSGGEQSCKSTTAMSIMAQVIKTAFSGICSIHDFEGCLAGETHIYYNRGGISIEQRPIKQVLDHIENPESDKFYPAEGTIWTSEGTKKYIAACVRKDRAITKITLNNGKTIRGHKHPIMTLNSDGLLEWKFMEDLKVGDKVIRFATC